MFKGNIPLVSAGTTNNGIAMYIKEGDGISKVMKGKCITLDMFGTVFYQPTDFYAVFHGRVNILYPQFAITNNIGLFFCNIISKRFKGKYSYSIMCNQKRLQRESLLLPVNEKNEPDYEYMEQYLKNTMTDKYNDYLQYVNNLK